MFNALIYVRVSSKRQEEEGNGLKSQEDICRDFGSRRKIPVDRVFSDTFTGGTTDRTGLNDLIKYVKKNKSKKYVVIFDDISRISRNLEGHLEIRRVLMEHGCIIHAPSRELKDDADSVPVESLLASMDQHQRMKNGEQVISRMKGRLLGGFWPFNLPYGLKRTKTKDRSTEIVSNQPRFSIVREALEGFAVNRFLTQAEVQRWLEKQVPFLKYHNTKSVTMERVIRLFK